jgi:two-component system, LytTR family, sensor kinase
MKNNRVSFLSKFQNWEVRTVWKHTLFWVCFFMVGYITDRVLYPNAFLSKEVVLFLTHNIFLFYAFSFCIGQFSTSSTNKTIRSIFLFILLIGLFYGMRILLNYRIYPVMDDLAHVPRETIVFEELMMNSFFWMITYFFYAGGYFFFQSSIQKQKDLVIATEEKFTKEKKAIQLEKEKIELEKENIQLENTALRAQINPHFLYNTLDFLYAKALPVSDELSDGVMKLSDIMRYSLKPQDAQGLVSLADEAEHINNIIEMNQLRFSNKLNVDFKVSNISYDVKIMPLLLITLVENVFKHGVTNSEEHPAIIVLEVTESNNIHFSTSNKKKTGPKEQSTSIGLNNTLKRLENMYGNRSRVSILNEADYFSIVIDIQSA